MINAVTVEKPLGNLQDEIAAIPDAKNLRVDLDSDGNVVVSGRVRDRQQEQDVIDRVDGLAGPYLGANGKVVDRLAMDATSQVDVKVDVLEVDRTAQTQLGLRLQSAQPSGVDANGAAVPPYTISGAIVVRRSRLPRTSGVPGKALTVGAFTRVSLLAPTLDLLISQGHARRLSSPNLMTKPGKEATFLVGGEIPIPVSNGLGTLSIEYKQYGVQLKVTPTIDADGSVDSDITPEVSDLDFADGININGFLVPALKTSRIQTDVTTQDGESIVMGGLLRRIEQKNILKIPLLGDIPILGELFRSTVVSAQRHRRRLRPDADGRYEPPRSAIGILARLRAAYAPSTAVLSAPRTKSDRLIDAAVDDADDTAEHQAHAPITPEAPPADSSSMQTSVPEQSAQPLETAPPHVESPPANRRERLGIGAFLFFVGLYIAAFLLLVATGNAQIATASLRYGITFATLSALTYLLTIPATQGYPPGPQPSALQRPLTFGMFAGVAVCLFAAAVTGALQTHFDAAALGPTFNSAQSLFHFGVTAFFFDAVFVFVALRLLGVPARTMGLARPSRGSGRVALFWIGLALLFVGAETVTGHQRITGIIRLIVRNVFQNGFSEEFLFRGALLSRLRAFFRIEWALLGQALLFGLWHFGTDMRAAGGNPLIALAYAITVQSVFGYALGFLVVRTRSIAISATFHALADATSII